MGGEIRARIEAKLREADIEGAVALLPPLDRDRDAALLRLELWRVVSSHPHVDEDTRAIEARYQRDVEVLLSVVATLIARAELRPKDEPPLAEDAFASRAIGILDGIDDLLANAGGGSTDVDALRAHAALARANVLRLAGRAHDAEATEAFARALALVPSSADAHFDAGLLHKWRGRWQACFDENVRALELGRDDRGVRWNIAISAIALGRGADAAQSFAALGIPAALNRAGMPIVAGLPSAELRVPSRGTGHADAATDRVPDRALTFEVVSVAPLSPCHGVVETPTLRDAAVDYGDVVLWDGVPLSVRKGADGAPIPRFPLLEVLRRGDERRFRFVALEQAPGDVAALGARLGDGAALYALETRVEVVCPRCAAGETLTRHAHLPAEPHRLVHGKLIADAAVDLRAVASALEEAARGEGRVKLAVPGLYEALGDARRAGIEHQAYRGIERVAMKKSVDARDEGDA